MTTHTRRALALILALLSVVGLVVATQQPAMAYGPGPCSERWAPTTGAVATHSDINMEYATFSFRLTKDELDRLKCVAPYLEIDFHLEGKWVPPQWDGYIVAAHNLPGAIHDTAASDFISSTPGVTRIYTGQLQSNTDYHVTIAWPPLMNLGSPGIWMAWVPSYKATEGYEGTLCNTLGKFTEAWCIFGYPSATYQFRSETLGVAQVPLDGNHVVGFGDWAIGPPASIPMLPALSLNFQFMQPLATIPASTSTQIFLRGDSAVLAKNDLADGGWTQETGPGSAKAIAAAGSLQMVLDPCNAVWAKDSVSDGGWVQETPCYGATQIAISSTGLQMLVDANSAVWAKYGIGSGGWTRETTDGNAAQIAVGGDTQMFIRGDSAVLARTGIGDNWVQETTPGNATAIAADATGMQAFIRGDAAVFARRGIGTDWQQQVGPGNAGAIAAGGGVLMFLRGDSAVFAKTNISNDGGWTQETEPATANAIAVGENGRQMLRTGNAAIWAKDGVGYGGWSQQVGDGNAAAIDVG